MKQFDQKNQIWYEQQDGVVKVGFTRSFLDGLDQCWHILPANNQRFREKAPLMVVETNDALISIMSPVSANFVQWEHKAQDFPDQLTENDIILTMTTARVQAQPRVQEDVLAVAGDMWEPPQAAINVRNGGGIFANGAAAPQQPMRRPNPQDALMRQIREQQELLRQRAQGEF